MSPTQSLQVIGFAPETVFGTFVAPTKFLPGIATPQDAVTVTQPTQSRGTRSQVLDVATQLTAGIQLSGELIPEVMSTLIAGWFGTGSDAKTGSAGAGYTHTLTPQNGCPSYSIEVDNDVYTQVLARRIVGNIIDQFTLTLSAAQIATMQFNTIAQRESTPATPGLPSNPTPAITTLQPMDFSLVAASLAGTSTTSLIDATLTGTNQTQRVQASNGQLYVTRLQPTQRKVTFSTTLDFIGAGSDPAAGTGVYTFWSGVAAGGSGGFIGAGGFQLALVTANNIPGTSNPYKVLFNLPTLRPQDQYTINAASDVLQQQLAWSVTQGSAANEINAVIVNSESSALA
jgi:hypothetical protein